MSRILNRWWEVQGRNGYWAIDEYRTVEGEPQNRGTYGTVAVSRKKEAELVCGALNEAYRHGREDWALYIDATTTPRVYRIKVRHKGEEVVNTTQYLFDSEVESTHEKVGKALNDLGWVNDLHIDIYPA